MEEAFDPRPGPIPGRRGIVSYPFRPLIHLMDGPVAMGIVSSFFNCFQLNFRTRTRNKQDFLDNLFEQEQNLCLIIRD